MNIQYRTIVRGAGYAELANRGRIRLEGPDSLSFLQALVSNDVADLATGNGVYATYLTPQGRMRADLEIYRREAGVLCSLAASLAPLLAVQLDQLIFAENTRVIDASAELSEVLVVGGLAAMAAATAVGLDTTALEGLAELSQVSIEDGFVARTGDSTLPSFRVFLPPDRRAALIAGLEAHGASTISSDTLEALRIAAGRAAWGAELNEDIIPLEAGLLDRAISTTKGCYVGQEVVIRILHRGGGRVARRLVRVESSFPAAIPNRGDVLVASDGKDAGRLTSVSGALDGDGWIALAYLSRDFAEIGRQVETKDGHLRATVTALAS